MPRRTLTISLALMGLLAQQTACVQVSKSNKNDKKDKKFNVDKIRKEVMNTGYWFALCHDVQSAWE